MTSPIDPIRRSPRPRRADRPAVDPADVADDLDRPRNLPVVAEPPPPTGPAAAAGGESVFSAQLMGQDGQKRGLRGGPETLGAARTVYVRTEYSGHADRRAPKGGAAKTRI